MNGNHNSVFFFRSYFLSVTKNVGFPLITMSVFKPKSHACKSDEFLFLGYII